MTAGAELRLDSAREIAAKSPPRLKAHQRTCLECGDGFSPLMAHGEFCSGSCRKAWNNRRMARGAELYDLFMALRFDRPMAQALGLWAILCRAAALYRKQDDDERAGRRSWAQPQDVLARKPYLKAVAIVAGKRR